MKSSRILSLFAAAVAAPALFAATASVNQITGKVVTVAGETETPVANGQFVSEGSLIETGASSSTVINLSNGGKLVIGANARVRISFNGDNLVITLLRGNIGGTFPANTTVATAGGTVSVAVGGTTGAVQFANGSLIAAPTSGTVSVKPVGNSPAITVPAGNAVTVSPTGTSKPAALTPESVEAINNGIPTTLTPAGSPENKPGQPPVVVPPKSELPDLSKIAVISPQ